MFFSFLSQHSNTRRSIVFNILVEVVQILRVSSTQVDIGRGLFCNLFLDVRRNPSFIIFDIFFFCLDFFTVVNSLFKCWFFCYGSFGVVEGFFFFITFVAGVVVFRLLSFSPFCSSVLKPDLSKQMTKKNQFTLKT